MKLPHPTPTLMLAFLALFVVWKPSPASGQVEVVRGVPDALGLLSSDDLNQQNHGSMLVDRLLADDPTPAVLLELGEGLADLSTHHASRSVRFAAVIEFVKWADVAADTSPGLVSRLVREVYSTIPDPGYRDFLIGELPRIGPIPGLVPLLREVALADDPSKETLAAIAIETLAKMGSEGRAELVRLHAEDSVKSALGRLILSGLAKRDFRPKGGG